MFKNTLPLAVRTTTIANHVRSETTRRLVFAPMKMMTTTRRSLNVSSSQVRNFTTTPNFFQEGGENNGDSFSSSSASENDVLASQFFNISVKRFPEETARILLDKINEDDIEIKPDGIIYLPEIKYRRILNLAFGPGGWGLVPRGNYKVERGYVCQQYALFCNGQFVSQAWGDQTYEEEGKMSYRSLATALEGAKSNALMRCCKDLGIASELWDPAYILKWKATHAAEVWAVHQKTNQRKKLYRRKDRPAFEYPYAEDTKGVSTSGAPKYKGSKLTSAAPMDGEPLFENPEEVQFAGGEVDLNEEQDVGMFDHMIEMNDVAASPTSGGKFNWNEQIKFGKYKGQTWTQAMKDSKFKSYLSWLINNGKASPQAKAALDLMEE